jgi:hypothetical protein
MRPKHQRKERQGEGEREERSSVSFCPSEPSVFLVESVGFVCVESDLTSHQLELCQEFFKSPIRLLQVK